MSKKSKSSRLKAKARRNKKRQLIYKQSQRNKKAVKKTRKVLRRIKAKEEKANNAVFADILNKLGSVTL
jgi:hypothetical protein